VSRAEGSSDDWRGSAGMKKLHMKGMQVEQDEDVDSKFDIEIDSVRMKVKR
jgi:hypothetical protein